jgi:fumarate reductase flavoprotein subunit
VTERLEAVDAGGTPIAGLYVAGVDAGGWQGDTYCFRLAGSSLGFAYGSGRIAGEQAAARARDDPAALEPTLPRAAR